MTFIMNQKQEAINSYIEAMVAIHPHLEKHPNLPLVYVKDLDDQSVPVLSGGGSGHEPAHIGYVGQGMLTAAIYGQLFFPPTAPEILEAIRFLDRGKGVFIIIKNFEADLREFSQAVNQARAEGHQVKYVLSHDDISIEPKKNFQIRGRGLAGTILLHKAIGFAAQQGATLDQLEEKGLISRQTCASDRRAKRIKLTEKAEPLISEMEAVINKTRAEILHGISAEELEQLITLIAKLEHNIIELQAKG